LADGLPAGWSLAAGRPWPPGPHVEPGRIGFALVARHATAAWLVVWPEGEDGPRVDLPLDPRRHRSGDVWHAELLGASAPLAYAWRLDRVPRAGSGPLSYYAADRLLLDPYARAVAGAERWGAPARERRSLAVTPPLAATPDALPRHAAADRVVYELCVRGFTAGAGAGVVAPGTFAGLLEKVPYLQALGVTTVELLPVTEWDEHEVRHRDPASGAPLRNLWGYSPLSFAAPKAGLAAAAATEGAGAALAELRRLVDALHAAGIEVVLDLVYNHTGERDGLPGDPVVSWRGIDAAGYYLWDAGAGRWRDATGCGNTVACNRPPVADLVLDSLRGWAIEAGVDGFRFDLASVLARGTDGEPLAAPPLLERLAADPVLADRVLIAEPWDAAGLYLLGFFARRGRWSEWNDRFREDVRRFVRGEPGMAGALAARLAGSRDLFGASPLGPAASVNYVTCHDGFTLADLVSYERKRNESNGEGNRDGSDWNASWNCGVEGPTDDPVVLALRRRQVRNLLTLLFVAQGVPMLLAGDELGRSQGGNNNAWCQDNPTGWIDWSLAERNGDLLRFVRGLIGFRRVHPVLRRRTFLTGEGTAVSARADVRWHGTRLGQPDWGAGSRCLAMHLAGEHAPEPDDDLYLAANAAAEPLTFELPEAPPGRRWLRVVATWLPSPRDLALPGEEEPLAARSVTLPSHACLLMRSG
jgi:glycogen operon protein